MALVLLEDITVSHVGSCEHVSYVGLAVFTFWNFLFFLLTLFFGKIKMKPFDPFCIGPLSLLPLVNLELIRDFL